MGTTTMPSAAEGAKAPGPRSTGGQSEIDRRRRRRAKISAQVHIKAVGSAKPLEEICMTVDVSRDGLLFTSESASYEKGQHLEVTFPYSNMTGALNQGRLAEIVRVVPQPGGKHGIAVHFNFANPESDDKKSVAPRAIGTYSTAAARAAKESVVLAVESEPRGAESMRNLLEPDGYTVVVVPTGQEALEILRTCVPSVLIADVESEEMSGHDLCIIVKQNERLQSVPVVLMTRSARPADYSTSHRLGAVVCMAKPFKPERLQQVVRLVAPPPALKIFGSRPGNT
jgi:CheY-like chemotaxis protein